MAEIASSKVRKTCAFSISGLCSIKTKKKPATKAANNICFAQKLSVVKAKPAKTVVKAFVASAVKSQF